MRFSNAIHCIIGDSRGDVIARARQVYEIRPRDEDFDDWLTGVSQTRLVGTVDQIAAELRYYRDVGADRIILIHGNHHDLDSIEAIGRHLVPRLRD